MSSKTTASHAEALNIQVRGIVQGVGFRPFVYRLAKEKGITGWVLNATEGVFIHAEGTADALDSFALALANEHPKAAVVKEVELHEASLEGFSDFSIRFSKDSETQQTTLVSPDLATCDECVQELFDPENRRYRYPFINCTNCGPRFTIMNGLPYDRPLTSMAQFTMCPDCQAEYDDPADRRFHAQPDACFECGPHLGWVACAGEGSVDVEAAQSGEPLAPAATVSAPTVVDIVWAHNRVESDALLGKAVDALMAGGIVGVKGLGGYHLVCDATNESALAKLRLKKRREGKAFAVMLPTVDAAKRFCLVSQAEELQLTSPARPIVLLRKRAGVHFARGLADQLPELGVMLPTTPVQHLLIHDFAAACKQAVENGAGDDAGAAGARACNLEGMLVMTSGNVHDEPIVTTEEDALEKLAPIADALLVNDRAIVSRYDDSVVRVIRPDSDEPVVQVVRRARGLAPVPVAIPVPDRGSAAHDAQDGTASEANPIQLFATGPEQKNTMTFIRGNQAFVSQHIGDMESVAVMDAWDETRKHYQELFRLAPTQIACDRHPEYLTSKWAHQQSLPVVEVQHHFAHVLSVMGENNLEGPVCGIAFDGTGYGMDRAIWGGEVLLCNLHAFERFANFAYVPLPGGAAAIKNPARITYGVLWEFDLLDHPQVQAFVQRTQLQAELLDQMIERGINTPLTSSVGRLFDAASALLGLCVKPRYEGEAAILLEAAVHEGMAAEFATEGQAEPATPYDPAAERYVINVIKNTASVNSTAEDTSVVLMDTADVFKAMLDDLAAGVDRRIIARRFHDAFVQVVVTMAEVVRAVYDISVVTLSGGVFMNRYLLEHALPLLEQRGFTVALNKDLPPNDASLSYGQAVLPLQAQTKE